MSNAWDDMRKAKEDEYFNRKNQEAMNRLASKQGANKPRLSPITGEAMEQVVLHGVVVDRCTASGGVWLDAGELEQILQISGQQAGESATPSWLENFFKNLTSV